MIISLKLIIVLIMSTISENCRGESSNRKRDGLVIFQKNFISWVKNFEPDQPTIPRWPTKGGIYDLLCTYNPIKDNWVPWFTTDYKWKNKKERIKADGTVIERRKPEDLIQGPIEEHKRINLS